MGTRGVVGFCLDEKYYVTYNHFDSYAKGLGAEVVNFIKYIREHNLLEVLKERVKPITFIQDDESDAPLWARRAYGMFADPSVGAQGIYNIEVKSWYQLLRNLQNGTILWKILNGEVGHIINNFRFLKDSLFCEYGYIINLDDETLDFYRGDSEHTNCKNGSGETKLPFAMKPNEDGYYPCKLRREFPFDELPVNWMNGVPVMNPLEAMKPISSGINSNGGTNSALYLAEYFLEKSLQQIKKLK